MKKQNIPTPYKDSSYFQTLFNPMHYGVQTEIFNDMDNLALINNNYALVDLEENIVINQKKKLVNVVIIGAGYVGFPLACAIANNKKYKVHIYDIDQARINKIKNKISPIQDAKAEEDIKKVELGATTDESILKYADYIVICVPTPVHANKKPDLTPVIKAAEAIAKNLQEGQTIILESTVNPGICEEIVLPILEKTGMRGGVNFEFAHCPERINPGDTKWNVYNIPRNVGAITKEGAENVAGFYRSFINAEINVVSSLKAAEATKILENTFRDVNIALMNEFAQFCDKMNMDVLEILRGASTKPFAFMPHFPGCGVGGHCIPVDPYYLIEKAREIGFDHKLVKTAREINDQMPSYTVNQLLNLLHAKKISIKESKIGLLGLTYKANSDDSRESPSFKIKKELLDKGVKVLAYDPYLKKLSDASLNKILQEASGVIIATGHKEFQDIKDWKNVKIIVDGRNCLNKEKIKYLGINYVGIGRGG